jgi:hypothetical protein
MMRWTRRTTSDEQEQRFRTPVCTRLVAPLSAGVRELFSVSSGSLAAASAAQIDISVPDLFNSAQSQASGSSAGEMKYLEQLGTAASPLRSDIEAQLAALGSSLTANDIVLRAQALSCAGCHRLNNGVALGGGLTWPASLGFTHVTERETESVGGALRFRLSDALIDVLLPARKAVVEDFLNNRPRPAKGPNHPLSGSTSHG